MKIDCFAIKEEPRALCYQNTIIQGEDGVGKRKWTDCVQSDIRAFGIKGDWKATALKAEVWVETVAEGGGGSWPRGEIRGRRG